MLIFKRHRNEAAMIGDDICITVMQIGREEVQLRIRAPSDLNVMLLTEREVQPPDEHGNRLFWCYEDEEVTIGDCIHIAPVQIFPRGIRLGIQAPVQIPVHRLEVYLAIKRGVPRKGVPGDSSAPLGHLLRRQSVDERHL